ncbi:MAG: hypothetical protein GY821_12720 [Gammaproteobacteria bacterium]|nr:hypothetical protein [Gammaproteobacteria bacterium]
MAVTTFETAPFPEQGGRGVRVVFTDDDGIAVVPNTGTIQWTLTNRPTNREVTPTVINSREQVDIASASTIYILLEGDDLAIQTGEENEASVERVLTVEFQYNSTNLGNNVDDKAQYIFKVENMYYPFTT